MKKVFFSFTKIAFFVLFIFLNLLSLAAPVFAQPSTSYVQLRDLPNAKGTVDRRLNQAIPGSNLNFGDFNDLFGVNSTLGISTATDWNTKPSSASDLTFIFNGAFADAATQWDRIADFDNDRIIFVLRFCNVSDGKPVEDSCALARVPYVSKMAPEINFPGLAGIVWSSNDLEEAIREIEQQVRVKQTAGEKIYHRGLSNITFKIGPPPRLDFDEPEVDSFSAAFKPTSFYKPGTPTIVEKNIVAGQTYQADLWYCAAAENGLGTLAGDKKALEGLIGTPADIDNLRIFGTLCDNNHLAYFRAAGFQFTAPTTQDDIVALNTSNQTVDPQSNTWTSSDSDSVLPSCGWFIFSKGTFVGCLAQLVYYIIYTPIAFIAGLFGQLFDFFLGYSISDEAYRMGFAVEGWKLIRDISNIFFIIILVWTGFATVFDIGSISMKKVVPTLIINALIINFSLFATRVVIDISNISARVFYNTMKVQNKAKEKIEVAGYKSISVLLVSSFNPQKIFEARAVQGGATGLVQGECEKDDDLECKENTDATFSAQNVESRISDAQTKKLNSNEYAGFFIVVSLLAAFIMVGVAKMFWKVTWFFLGRTIGLYVSMIFSPFAFLTRGNVPLVGNIGQLKWSDWASDLTKYAMLAPIFILFLYVIVLFANSKFTLGLSGTSFFETIISVAVPMLILYFLLKQAVGIAEEYSGRIGKLVQSSIDGAVGGFGGVVGGGIGLAAGAAAFAGRNIAGRGMKLYGNRKTSHTIKNADGSDKLDAKGNIMYQTNAMRWAANADTSRTSRFMNKLTNRSQAGSWDVRNLGLKVGGKEYTAGKTINRGFALAGEKLSDNISASAGLGQDKALGKGGKPGGILKLDEERKKRRSEELANRIKYDHLSDEDAKTVWAEVKRKKIEKYKQEHWAEEVEAAKKKAVEESKKEMEDAEKELVVAQEDALIKSEEAKKIEKDLADARSALTQDDKDKITRLETELADAKKADSTTIVGQKRIAQVEQDLENAKGTLKAKEGKVTQVEVTLKEARGAETASQEKVALSENKVSDAKNKNESAQNISLQSIQDGKHPEAKEAAIKLAEKKEIERLDKYGTIKNKSGLEMAMRAEYAEDLRNNSMWMKDGKPRNWVGALTGAAGLVLAAALPGIGTIIGGLMIANVAKGLNNNIYGDIESGATKKLINDAYKSQGRGNLMTQLTDKIELYDKLIFETIKKQTGDIYKKFSDIPLEKLEASIDKEIESLEVDKDGIENKTIAGRMARRKIDRKIAALEKVQRDREVAQEKLDKITSDNEKKTKVAEEKGKPKDDSSKNTT